MKIAAPGVDTSGAVTAGREFRILGPLEVRRDGHAIRLGGPKQRAVLATLLINAGTVVSTDRIIDAVWGDEAPDGAPAIVQVYVSQLRKSIGADAIATQRPGYVLHTEDASVDARRFLRMTEEARASMASDPAAAAERLSEALTIWRGPALADFAFDEFARAEIERLEEARLGALEDRVDADLTLGRHAALAGELEKLVAANPLRERFRGQLALALYRAGRQADALGVLRSLRETLVEELGIDPSRSIQELERAILGQDPSLDLADTPRRAGTTPPAAAPTRKRVTAVLVELALAPDAARSLDAEALHHVMQRYAAETHAIVSMHGGTRVPAVGDAVAGVFGVPVLHEDDAVRAVRALVDARDAIAAMNADVRRSFGVEIASRGAAATGEVLVTDQPATAGGPPFAAAARLVRSAGAGDVVVDAQTERSVHAEFDASPAGESVYRVTGPVEASSRFAETPLIGRAHEKAAILDAFDRAAEAGESAMVTILGDAGMGKTRLGDEISRVLCERALVLRAACVAGAAPGAILGQIVSNAAGVVPGMSDGEVAARVASFVPAPVAGRAAELAEGIRGGSDPVPAAYLACLDALARERPLALLIDDVQEATPAALDVVEETARALAATESVIVCLTRPELLEQRPRWGGSAPRSSSIAMGPLAFDECAALVDALLAPAPVTDEIRSFVAAASEGVPLFVREIAASLVDDGRVRLVGGAWVPAAPIDVLPAGLASAVSARLDRLDASARTALGGAAVIGRTFDRSTLDALLERDASDALNVAVAKDLIRPVFAAPAGEVYAFRTDLIRGGAYAMTPKQERARLHERLAELLEAADGSDEAIGGHLASAVVYRRAVGGDEALDLAGKAATRLAAAARLAHARGDARSAQDLLERSVALLDQETRARLAVLPDIGWAIANTARPPVEPDR